MSLACFEYIRCRSDLCLKKWTNALPDFCFVLDKMEKQVELFLPGFPSYGENVMNFLYGLRLIAENVSKKSQKTNNL